jgi:hypothetical protein
MTPFKEEPVASIFRAEEDQDSLLPTPSVLA